MSEDAQEKVDFFISYTGADVAWAEWIAWILESDGYHAKIQAWDFNAGGRFMQQMGEAADLAHRMIAVLSRQYFQSDFAKLEFNAAVVEDPLGKSGFLIPVRIEKCDPGRLHRDLVYIDLVGLSRDDACSRLLLKV